MTFLHFCYFRFIYNINANITIGIDTTELTNNIIDNPLDAYAKIIHSFNDNLFYVTYII